MADPAPAVGVLGLSGVADTAVGVLGLSGVTVEVRRTVGRLFWQGLKGTDPRLLSH